MRSHAKRQSNASHDDRRGVEGLIARLLFWGGVLSIALVLAGLILYAARGGFHDRVIELHPVARLDGTAHPRQVFVSLSEVARGLGAHPVRPTAVIALGLTLLLMTPVLGVAAAIPGFLVERDYRYAIVATVVFALLVVAMTLAGGIG